MLLRNVNFTVAAAGLAALIATAPVARADHNSVWGEGWANMPNDIHNTRIDTLGTDDDTFTDFVRYGEGADSVNRFLDSGDDLISGGGMMDAVGSPAIDTTVVRGAGRGGR